MSQQVVQMHEKPEKEADHPEAGQDPPDSVRGPVQGLRGAKTSRWGLTTETLCGP